MKYNSTKWAHMQPGSLILTLKSLKYATRLSGRANQKKRKTPLHFSLTCHPIWSSLTSRNTRTHWFTTASKNTGPSNTAQHFRRCYLKKWATSTSTNSPSHSEARRKTCKSSWMTSTTQSQPDSFSKQSSRNHMTRYSVYCSNSRSKSRVIISTGCRTSW